MSSPLNSPVLRAFFVVATFALLAAIAWGVSLGVQAVQHQLPDSASAQPAPQPAPQPGVVAATPAQEGEVQNLRVLEPLRVGGGVTAPRKLSGDPPIYPEIARRARLQGIVVLEATIDRTGRVTSTRILKDLPMGLGESARDAVAQWRFAPATQGGEPVDCYFTLTVEFNVR